MCHCTKKKCGASKIRETSESRKFVWTSYVSAISQIFLAEGSDHFGDAKQSERAGGGEVSHTDCSKKAKDLSGTREADRLYLYVVRTVAAETRGYN